MIGSGQEGRGRDYMTFSLSCSSNEGTCSTRVICYLFAAHISCIRFQNHTIFVWGSREWKKSRRGTKKWSLTHCRNKSEILEFQTSWLPQRVLPVTINRQAKTTSIDSPFREVSNSENSRRRRKKHDFSSTPEILYRLRIRWRSKVLYGRRLQWKRSSIRRHGSRNGSPVDFWKPGRLFQNPRQFLLT